MNHWVEMNKLATEKCSACGKMKSACMGTEACVKEAFRQAQDDPPEPEQPVETYVTEEGETKRRKKKKPEEEVGEKQMKELKGWRGMYDRNQAIIAAGDRLPGGHKVLDPALVEPLYISSMLGDVRKLAQLEVGDVVRCEDTLQEGVVEEVENAAGNVLVEWADGTQEELSAEMLVRTAQAQRFQEGDEIQYWKNSYDIGDSYAPFSFGDIVTVNPDGSYEVDFGPGDMPEIMSNVSGDNMKKAQKKDFPFAGMTLSQAMNKIHWDEKIAQATEDEQSFAQDIAKQISDFAGDEKDVGQLIEMIRGISFKKEEKEAQPGVTGAVPSSVPVGPTQRMAKNHFQRFAQDLDLTIEFWRKKVAEHDPNSPDRLMSDCYLDAYQSVRKNLFGNALPIGRTAQMSTDEFLQWHDQSGGPGGDVLEKVYNIFKEQGFGPEDNVDTAYEGLPHMEKLMVTNFIRQGSRTAQNPDLLQVINGFEHALQNKISSVWSIALDIDIEAGSGKWDPDVGTHLKAASDVLENDGKAMQDKALGHLREAYRTSLSASHKKAMTIPEIVEDIKEDFGYFDDSAMDIWVQENEDRLTDEEKMMIKNYMDVDASRKKAQYDIQIGDKWEAATGDVWEVIDFDDPNYVLSSITAGLPIRMTESALHKAEEQGEFKKVSKSQVQKIDPIQEEIIAGRKAGLSDETIKLLLNWEKMKRT